MSTASEYRQKAAEARKQLPTEKVTMPSGFEWELRRPDLQAWVVTGRLPQSLLTTGMKAWREQGITKADPVKAMQAMSDEDFFDAMIFQRELVREACINPRIVVGATGEDEIDPSELLDSDFIFILNWIMEGAGLKGLLTFRGGQTGGATGNSSHSKKQRSKSQQPVSSG